MIDTLKPLIKKFMPYAQEKMGFKKPPRLFLRQDDDNAGNPLGKTAFYDPEQVSVTLYISGRHPKDVMRSLSHELVHHKQNCDGMFDDVGEMGEGYAQNDDHLREMEREAYEKGNMCFRDWEDSIKNTIYFENLQKGDYRSMSTKKWKDNELKGLLTEQWGFSMDLSKLNEAEKPDYIDIDKDGDKEESMKKAAADKKKKGGKEEKEKVEESEVKSKSNSTKRKEGLEYEVEKLERRLSGEKGRMKSIQDKIKKEKAKIKDLKEKIGEKKGSAPKNLVKRKEGLEYEVEKLERRLGNQKARVEHLQDRIKKEKAKIKDIKESQGVFAPNHYCVHHGGIERNGSIEMAEAVSHNYNKRLGKVTHYDMKFSDGFILENVAFEDIQVTNASLAQEHMHAAKRDDEELDEMHCGGKRDDEELDEVAASSGRRSPHADRRGDDERKRPMQEQVLRSRIRKLLKNVKFK